MADMATSPVTFAHEQHLVLPSGWRGSILDAAPREAWSSFIETLLRDPSALPGYAVLKYSGRLQVCRARLGDGPDARDVICKQSRVDGFLRQRLAALRPTRARQAAQRATWLREAGVATAEPLAILESTRADREAWLITAALNDVVDLDHVAMTLLPRAAANEGPRIRRGLSQAVAAMLAKFPPAGVHHRDLKASNILLTNWNAAGGPPTAWIVDVDGVSRCARGSPAKERQRLVRLGASLAGHPGVRAVDVARFLIHYAAALGRPRKAWKSLFRTCEPMVISYNRRAAGRKTGKLDGYGG